MIRGESFLKYAQLLPFRNEILDFIITKCYANLVFLTLIRLPSNC